MKPIQTKIKESQYNSKGKQYTKKYLTPAQSKLPDIDSQVIICDPSVIKAFQILNSAFLGLISTRNPEILSQIREMISKEEADLIREVAQDVLG